MSIETNFKNPPSGKGNLARFTQGEIPAAGSTYQAYGVNDQSSLFNSALHNEYSTIGVPNVNLANDTYNSGQKTPTQNLDLTPGVINDGKSGFVHEYTPNNKYTDQISTSA
jgi:hypothetical protein